VGFGKIFHSLTDIIKKKNKPGLININLHNILSS